jgi:tRNA (uracil-5-)-methyltransferase TRM9
MSDDSGSSPAGGVQTVRETYDRIADHFSKTRAYPWPEVESFLDGREGRVGLDVGCGNGSHAELLAERCERVIGVDLSRAMLSAARDRIPDSMSIALAQGDAGRFPVGADVVDLGVYVATLPHLPTGELRVASLDELARVLTPGGRALVSAWSTDHDRFDETEGFDTTVDWTLPGGETVDRFYHIYDPAEFRGDVGASALELRSFELSSGNCYAVVGPDG